MKQRKSKQVRLFSGMLIGIVMIAVLARIVYLNHCYPSPKVITYTENDTIKLGNYEIKQTGWEWGDGSLLKEKCSDYVYDQMDDGSEYPLDSVRVGFITLSHYYNNKKKVFCKCHLMIHLQDTFFLK